MKILLVYPQYPDTFWSFKHALKFVSKKASFPPLGLLTVAAMLPHEWEKKLIDMNVTRLTNDDIKWADYVFISAMVVQQNSVKEVITQCKRLNTKIVAGGPLFTSAYEEFDEVDYLVLNEAELTLPSFLTDLSNGCARHIYTSTEYPDIAKTPVPAWGLIDKSEYSSLSVQYSRGCPFDCEFCDIVVLNGHKPRSKGKAQMLAELDVLYEQGWRAGVFIVDDNFIGNKREVKAEILPAIIGWQKRKKYPFALSTEASINLADDEELMQLMVEAGFGTVFVGIETPNEESLVESHKSQNRSRDLIASVKKIQSRGLEVQGGFIVGFDSDPSSIFKDQIDLIQKSGIVTAMVGLLNAPTGTKLYQRLKKENRLLKDFAGSNTDCNFTPKMELKTLLDGYKLILNTIYSHKHYYERIRAFLKEFRPDGRRRGNLQFHHIVAFIKSIWFLGLKEKGRRYYWRLFVSSLLKHPWKFPVSISLAIYGYHFRKVVEKYVNLSVGEPVNPVS